MSGDGMAPAAGGTFVLRSPRLWTSDAKASWRRVGALVDAHAIAQTAMSQLTGGVFLTGLALALGAGPFTIGVLAALPLASKIAQIGLSWWIERAGHWRSSTIAGAVVSRVALLIVTPLALLQGRDNERLAALIIIIATSSLAASVFELSFLTWMAELIPEPLRGVFWGRRGRNAGIVGIVASLLASLVLDGVSQEHGAADPRFAIVFGAGAVVGLVGIGFLRRLPSPRRTRTRRDGDGWHTSLTRPLGDPNYRRFLLFSALWSFAAGYMAPFYLVYMLQGLHLSFVAVTALSAITNGLMAVSQTHWGRLGDHFGTKPVLRVGTYLIAVAPLVWLTTTPDRIWPVVIVQIVSGFGWSAYHVSLSNLSLKLAPEDQRPSYLASFAALSGLAEGLAPLLCGSILALTGHESLPDPNVLRVMMAVQLALFGAATMVPSRIVEPGGKAVGHMIRVMARFRAMDASRPVALLFEYGYTHLARIADLIAREFPRDAERL